MRHLPLTAILVAVFAVLPTAAAGQAGQRPDPDSPAGVEYQLPLEQARKNAARGDDGGGKRAGGGDPARRAAGPLFGAGIVARKAGRDRADAGSGDTQDGRNGSGGDSSPSGAREDTGAGNGEDAIRRSTVGGSDSDDSATWRTAGIALAVLLAGGLFGFGLRRGLGQSAD